MYKEVREEMAKGRPEKDEIWRGQGGTKLQIYAFYFLTFEEADCTIFTRLLSVMISSISFSFFVFLFLHKKYIFLFQIFFSRSFSSTAKIKTFSSPPKNTFSFSKYFQQAAKIKNTMRDLYCLLGHVTFF